MFKITLGISEKWEHKLDDENVSEPHLPQNIVSQIHFCQLDKLQNILVDKLIERYVFYVKAIEILYYRIFWNAVIKLMNI